MSTVCTVHMDSGALYYMLHSTCTTVSREREGKGRKRRGGKGRGGEGEAMKLAC